MKKHSKTRSRNSRPDIIHHKKLTHNCVSARAVLDNDDVERDQ